MYGITKLYHFTDRDNLDSIVTNGGLYSWADCEAKGINIPKPGEVVSREISIQETVCKTMCVYLLQLNIQ